MYLFTLVYLVKFSFETVCKSSSTTTVSHIISEDDSKRPQNMGEQRQM